MPATAASTRPLLLFVHGSAQMYGSDKVLLNLATALAARPHWQPVVALHEDGPLRDALEAAAVEVHVCEVVKITRAMFSPLAPVRLARMLGAALRDFDRIVAGRRVGLVYSNTLAVLAGAWWARQRDQPHLWHVHEIILKPRLASLLLPRLAERYADYVISNSNPTHQWLLGQVPNLAGRSRVIFNGQLPPREPCASAIAAFRSQVDAGPDCVVLTLAGRLNHWKGQDLLIDATALLHRQGALHNVRVALVGDVFAGHGDVRRALEARVQASGLQGIVKFVPFVDEIFAVWRGSQVAVVPSTEPEPFGMVAIEAMAASLPVVAAAHGGLLDIVVDGVTGLLFEPRNAQALAAALQRLIEDPDLRARLGAMGLTRQAEHFSLRQQAQATEAVCMELARA